MKQKKIAATMTTTRKQKATVQPHDSTTKTRLSHMNCLGQTWILSLSELFLHVLLLRRLLLRELAPSRFWLGHENSGHLWLPCESISCSVPCGFRQQCGWCMFGPKFEISHQISIMKVVRPSVSKHPTKTNATPIAQAPLRLRSSKAGLVDLSTPETKPKAPKN